MLSASWTDKISHILWARAPPETKTLSGFMICRMSLSWVQLLYHLASQGFCITNHQAFVSPGFTKAAQQCTILIDFFAFLLLFLNWFLLELISSLPPSSLVCLLRFFSTAILCQPVPILFQVIQKVWTTSERNRPVWEMVLFTKREVSVPWYFLVYRLFLIFGGLLPEK